MLPTVLAAMSSTDAIHGGPLGASPGGAEGLAGRFATAPFMPIDRPPPRRRRTQLHVRPFDAFEAIDAVPRPRHTAPSGLLPAAEAQTRPEPPVGSALRLRRAVALFVVLGTLALLAYAAAQRVANDRETTPHVVPP